MVGLAALAGPVLAGPPPLASAWLERQQAAAADEANAARATPSKSREPKEQCRVVNEWKAGDTVVEHRVCDDAPAPAPPSRQG